MRVGLSVITAGVALLVWACSAEQTTEAFCPPTGNEVVSVNDVQPDDTVYVTVDFASSITDEDRDFVSSIGGEIIYEYKGRPAALISILGEALAALEANPRVLSIVISRNIPLDC
ncbi:MAG: hypothetical protein AMS25_17255 [Gemmatimonas sp. SM23_52]|nr:MAG: hypothetical protein AMS25_17255 [Gemmatimonas sp. SM23_52]